MSKRSATDNLEKKEQKKVKAEEVTLQSILAEIFEPDPATDSLEAPAKEEEIKQLEERLGLTMPDSYKQLLRLCNGGQLRKRFYKIEEGSYAAISYISGIYDEPHSVLQSKEMCEDLGIGSGYVFLCGSGPEFFALNFNSDAKNPEVVSILQEEDGGIQTTKIATNFETFLTGLEFREEDCLVISIKSTVPVQELEATVIAKLKEAGIDIKSEEEIERMRAEFLQNEFADVSDGDDLSGGDDESSDEDGADIPDELGARTNAVGDLGGSSDEDGSIEGGEAFDFGAFDDDSFDDEDEEINKHCSLEPLEPKEYPAEAKEGYNILFTYAMLNPAPYEADVQKIKTVLATVPGIDALHFVADPIAPDVVKHNFD